jgi:hypothetical protein
MDELELKIIDVFICKLRKKLANASEGRNFIETVWAAATCRASLARKKSASPPDPFYGELCQALALPTRLRQQCRGFRLSRASNRPADN